MLVVYFYSDFQYDNNNNNDGNLSGRFVLFLENPQRDHGQSYGVFKVE